MALPHPTSQLALSIIMAEERKSIRATIEKSPLTLYRTKPVEARLRAFRGLDFKSRERLETETLAKFPVILTTDIANFFHTIYSHSLPWAVLTKARVKTTREKGGKELKELEAHWTSRLDTALQRSNSRETFGIPVGPDTSRIIAEVLLSGLHDDPNFTNSIRESSGYRLVDDFFIGFKSEEAARKCLDALRKILWEYNLHLNESKTRIIKSSSVFGEGWRHEMDTFQLDNTSRSKQRASVQRFLELTLRLCDNRQDAQPAAFFCRRLVELDIQAGNFAFIRDCMLRIARDFTTCLKFLFVFVTNHRNLFQESATQALITAWIRQILEVHAHRGHDLEISWMLILCGVLGVKVDQAFLSVEQPVVSPVVLSILGLLSEDGLLAENWEHWRPSDHGTSSLVNGRNWLPYYEAVRRNWTTDPLIIAAVRGDPLFTKLLTAEVTFLDNSDFLSQVCAPHASGSLKFATFSTIRSINKAANDDYS